MPRCRACDVVMTDFEVTRKIYTLDNRVEYPDLCNKCFKGSGIGEVCLVREREDLSHTDDIMEDNIFSDDLEE